jgi:hypothetical protein
MVRSTVSLPLAPVWIVTVAVEPSKRATPLNSLLVMTWSICAVSSSTSACM